MYGHLPPISHTLHERKERHTDHRCEKRKANSQTALFYGLLCMSTTVSNDKSELLGAHTRGQVNKDDRYG